MDTSLNSAATLYLCDIHKRYIRPKAGDRESMRILHSATLIVGIAGTLTALAMLRVKSALDAWWNLQGIFTGGMLGLFLLGLISRKARNPHAVVSVVVGALLILWLSLSKTGLWPDGMSGWANPLHSFLTIILGTSSIVLLGALIGHFADKRTGSSKPNEDRNLK
jgi:SSS family solute:Na+ symporter